MPEGMTAPPGAPLTTRVGEPLRREASVRPSSFNAEARTVEVIWTTGADVRRFDWWTGRSYTERLRVTEEAVDLGRLNAGASVLNTHSSWDLGDVLGVVERAWIEGGRGLALLRFSEREEVAPILRDIQDGILRNISVGYWVDEWLTTQGSDGTIESREAVRWTPGEISFVPIPADPGAQTRGAPSTPAPTARVSAPTTPPATPAHQQEASVPDTNVTPAGNPPAQTEAEQRAAATTAAREAETTRIREITVAARSLGLEGDAAALIDGGVDVASAQTRLIALMVERRAAGGTPAPSGIDVVRDEGDTARRGLQDALLHRAGLLRTDQGGPAALPEYARRFRGFRMLDFAGEVLRQRGMDTRGMLPVEIAGTALGLREYVSRASPGLHSVNDFPNLLANTASKAMGRGYTTARRTFQAWARKRTLPDFKTFSVINLSGAPQLLQISPTGKDAGEIQFGTIGEAAEAYQLARYGRRIAVTFEAIVNDDMDGFTRLPAMFGTAAARLESDLVYSILNSNPNMADGNALFSAAHTNIFGNGVAGYSAGDGVLNVTGLGKARQAMRTQTAPNGDILDLDARWLLVPAALEGAALQYTSMAYVPAAQGNINPFANSLTPIVEPRLTSASQWYVIADSDQADTIEYGYLEGMEEPQITTYTDEDTDGVIVKCAHSFGAKATDWHGMARSSGT